MNDDDFDFSAEVEAERKRLKAACAALLVDLATFHRRGEGELTVDPRTDKIVAMPMRRPRAGRPAKPAAITQPRFLRGRWS